MMTIGSLFSGIGGLELGLERALGGRVLWQCEVDSYRREVLAKNWPEAKRYENVETLDPEELEPVDLICGGFPCQDISSANHHGRGLRGARSGLWREFNRIVQALRPVWVVVENVAQRADRWVDHVRGALVCAGYTPLALEIPPWSVGSRQSRPRVFVVARAHHAKQSLEPIHAQVASPQAPVGHEDPFDWPTQLELATPVHGFSTRVGRALGDAVVPACARVIGHIIASIEYGEPVGWQCS